MSLDAKESERIKTALQQPGAVLHDGGFYLLFKYGRWHLMTTGYTAGPNARQFVQTLKFMNEAEVGRRAAQRDITFFPPGRERG